jgi:hypothetical protein
VNAKNDDFGLLKGREMSRMAYAPYITLSEPGMLQSSHGDLQSAFYDSYSMMCYMSENDKQMTAEVGKWGGGVKAAFIRLCERTINNS